MKRLVVLMLIAAIAPARGHPAFPFPTVDGVLKLHYPGSDRDAGNVLFWRISETPSDIATDISLPSFFSDSDHTYVALIYKASDITDTCRPVGPPLMAYSAAVQDYQPMALFFVEYSVTLPTKYSIPPRKATFDPADANSILNHMVVIYPVLPKTTGYLNQFLDWKNTPDPTLCGVIEPASSELRRHVAPDGWEAAQKASATTTTTVKPLQLPVEVPNRPVEVPKQEIKCPNEHGVCVLRIG